MSNGAWDDETDEEMAMAQQAAEERAYGGTGRLPDDEDTVDDELTEEQAYREQCGCDQCLFGGPCAARVAS